MCQPAVQLLSLASWDGNHALRVCEHSLVIDATREFGHHVWEHKALQLCSSMVLIPSAGDFWQCAGPHMCLLEYTKRLP